jgi:type I restriction enzyme M protein
LRNFQIIAIVELGSGTFMATGTNTVTLFLKKRNKFFAQNLEF